MYYLLPHLITATLQEGTISIPQVRKWRHNQINSLPKLALLVLSLIDIDTMSNRPHSTLLSFTLVLCLGIRLLPMYQVQAHCFYVKIPMSAVFAIVFYLEFILRDGSCHSYHGLDQNAFVV